ncbi:hypothetical protein BC936DRAFT_145734 [Jimgerdemannia flammicorona]|uniref:Mannose-P-dolichol utilization defect 1 protein homolog n=1 Tax=Jimgerdemannia flammicorona TaxID=994334 RepID=A0A433D9C0_9FUNG|nr:hypothetical protein BC936DRAFT_145734 [Jimgerdemannia flammicorona]
MVSYLQNQTSAFLQSQLGYCYPILSSTASDPHCNVLFVSKLLGNIVLLTGTILKIPQISTYLSSKSVAGLSLPALLLEIHGFVIGAVYNVRVKNPFSTYGEGVSLLLQDVIILGLYGLYAKQMGLVSGSLFGFMSLGIGLYNQASTSTLQALMGICIPVFALSGITQLLLNYRQKHLGNASSVTAIFGWLMGSCRVFTTFVEVEDRVLFFGSILGVCISTVGLVQMVLYGDNTKKYLEGVKRKAKEELRSVGKKVE